MAVTVTAYHSFKQKLGQAVFNFTSDTLKIVLLNASYTPVAASHDELADLTNEVANGNGYTTGGVALANKTWTLAAGVMKLDADDASWAASGGDIGPARYGVLYDDTVSGDPLICYIDFGADKTAGDGTSFIIRWDSAGVLTLT